MHLKTRNVNSAFHTLVQLFSLKSDYCERGNLAFSDLIEKRPSRNGNVLMANEPITITYTHPRERVLFNPARDANPFFHLYEALWMLAGRNDVGSVAYYAKQMREYSDDGETLNGAYGYRWRGQYLTIETEIPPSKEFPYGCRESEAKRIDQLDILADHLKAQPESRRAVLQMWNVEDDLLKVGRGWGEFKAYMEGVGNNLDDFTQAQLKDRYDEWNVSSKDVCCNLSVMFSVRTTRSTTRERVLPTVGVPSNGSTYLDMTVTNRSNDLIWGLLGANYCLAANTKLASPEGNITVKELTDRFGSGELTRYPVYSFDTKTKDFRLSWCTWAWKTGRKKVLEIGWDDGTTSRMTADHRLFRKKQNSGKFCEEVRAGELKLGDRVWAGKLWTTASGRKQIPKRLGVSTSGGNVENVARAYWEFVNGPLPEGYVVHHRDEDKTNDRLDNLEAMTRGGHGRHHIAEAHPMHAPGANAKQRASRRRFFDNMTSEQRKKWSDDRRKKPSNHVVVSIREAGVEDVYDFTVPGDHNAMLDNGVMVHNCHFTILQEYLAARLGAEVGVYHHFTNNLHVYDWNWKPEEWLAANKGVEGSAVGGPVYLPTKNAQPTWNHVPLVKDPAKFEEELSLFVHHFDGSKEASVVGRDSPNGYSEPFLRRVAQPALMAFQAYKRKNKGDVEAMLVALEWAREIEADDWRIACTNWLQRRMK